MTSHSSDSAEDAARSGRFAIFVDGLAGSTQRDLELARRLTERGHEVVVAGPVDLTDDARAAGVDYRYLSGSDRRQAELAALPRPSRIDRRAAAILDRLRTGRRVRRESLADREVERLLDEHDPDLVIVESEYFTAALSAIAAGRRVAIVSGLYSIMPSPTNPPLHTSLRPGVDSPDAIATAWADTMKGGDAFRRSARWSLKGAATPFRHIPAITHNIVDLDAFARTRGLRLEDHVETDVWLRPFAISGVETYSLTPSALEFAEPAGNWHTVGALLPAGPGLDRTSEEDRAALAALRDRRAAEPGRPLVYATVGTFWRSPVKMTRLLVRALADCPDLDAVVGLGSLVGIDDLGPIGDNVTAVSWAPQLELLPEVDLAITHGGTSLIECAAAGVPVVCSSARTNDQNGNVARAVHAGLAIEFDHRTISPDELTALVRSTLADDARRARVAEIADEIRAEAASEAAVVSFEREAGLRL